jgi:adenosylhomocysteine nucleosidase
MLFDDAGSADGAPFVALIAALEMECASLRRRAGAHARWRIVQCGPGAARAGAAAARALETGARALVSFGFAGALVEGLAPGVVLVPRNVVSLDGGVFPVDEPARLKLAALADELHVESGPLLTVPAALESPEAKRAAGGANGAVAVDMESAAIAAVAARSGVPFVALRVVIDAVDDALPRGAEQWIDEHGRRRVVPALRAVAAVGQWGPLLTLAKRYRVASRALDRLVRELLARGLLADDTAAARRARG